MRVAVLPLALATSLAIGAAPAAALDEQEPAAQEPIAAPAMIAPAPAAPSATAPTGPARSIQPYGAAPAASAAATSASAPAAVAPAPAATPPAYTVPATSAPSSSVQPSSYQAQAARVAPSIPVPAAPLPGVIEKLGQGDRAFLAGDYRAALFAYQDAVYVAPQYAPARVKLGRAYLALRYPAQAILQAEQALALQPGNEDAARLAQEARNPPPKPPASAPAAAEQAQAAPRPDSSEPSTQGAQPRVYRFAIEPEQTTAPPQDGVASGPAAPAADQSGAPPREQSASVEQRSFVAQAEAGPGQGYADMGATGARTPAERYRAALEFLSRREYPEAIHELTEAIAGNPKLAVAYAARGSAQFGLGKYREASDDYRAALFIDANLATPLYGLAECLRLLGDRRGSVEMYRRYADSHGKDVREDLRAAATRRVQELR